MTPSILLLDTADDRREIWHLLHKLSPERRIGYLQRACAAVRARDRYGNGPVPMGMAVRLDEARRCDRGNERLTNEVYADIIAMCNQYDLDIAKLAVDLEATVKRGYAADVPDFF
jgi:hypothetical protein